MTLTVNTQIPVICRHLQTFMLQSMFLNKRTNGPVNAHLVSWPLYISAKHTKSNRKAMNMNWSNQKANIALKTKTGNKKILQMEKNTMITNC